MTSDIDQMLVNEYNSLQRQIEAREREIIDLEDEIRHTLEYRARQPRWYNVEFDFEAGDLEPQERSFFVSGGTYFQPYTLGSALRVSGNTAITTAPGVLGQGQVITAALPWGPLLSANQAYNTRQAYFDYFWQIRDTGSDREWQNEPQPSLFMCGGGLGNIEMPTPGTIRGGSEVFVRIIPTHSLSGAQLGLFDTVARYKLTISFFGLEAR